MSDIALEWNNSAGAGSADFQIVLNDLKLDEGLRTSVILSLFTDRQAEPGDVLPDGGSDRRGWWADAVANVAGDKMGSRLWLLARSKSTADVLSRAEEYAREALQWLIDDRVASQIDVSAERLTAPLAGYGLLVKIYRPDFDPSDFRFSVPWAAEEARIQT